MGVQRRCLCSLSQTQILRMSFNKYVELGRVCRVQAGEDAGRLVVIVDVVDANRALVDAPKDFARRPVSFKHLALTNIKVDMPRGARKKTIGKTFAEAGWAQKIARRQRRANLNDFERFQTMVFRK